MARKARVEYEGACYHVINRGNFRQNIFTEPGAAESFEKALFEAVEKYGWKLSAYVIMSNHFHLALELTEPNLSLGMKWLQGTWVMRNNLFLKRVGRPFQGRYKSILIEPGVLNNVVSYIHLNPRRAGLEKKGEIGSYRWSSLHLLPKKRNRPVNLLPDEALLSLGGLKDSGYAWKKYNQYLEALAENEPRQRELEFEKLSKGWCRGSQTFRKEQLKSLKDKESALGQAKLNKVSKSELRDLAESIWEDRLKQYAKDFGISLNRLGTLKSDPQKVILATLMKRRTSASNGWLAEQLKMGHPASVSQFVGRFSRGESPERKQVEAYLSRSKV
jgi:REP element-mobilizing transposase RayT